MSATPRARKHKCSTRQSMKKGLGLFFKKDFFPIWNRPMSFLQKWHQANVTPSKHCLTDFALDNPSPSRNFVFFEKKAWHPDEKDAAWAFFSKRTVSECHCKHSSIIFSLDNLRFEKEFSARVLWVKLAHERWSWMEAWLSRKEKENNFSWEMNEIAGNS